MTVLRRLDAVLEPSKQAVLKMKASLDQAHIVHQDPALRQASGHRIAEVHSGSSLFTGDAAQRKRNIRRWIIENDWLEASAG